MSLAIFGWLTVRYRNIRSYEFQITVFIIVYIIGELLEDYKIPSLSTLSYIGSQIHIVSAGTISYNIMVKIVFHEKKWKKDDR